MSRRQLAISDHALVRWLERSGALDVAALRTMLSASLDKAAQAGFALGSSNFLILADGLVYHVRDGVLVSCLIDEGQHVRTGRLRPDRGPDRAGGKEAGEP